MVFLISGKVEISLRSWEVASGRSIFHSRHSLKATEDADLHYLYIKDRTWTLIGSAADEGLPEEAPSATGVRRRAAVVPSPR